MTVEETKRIIRIIAAAFPNFQPQNAHDVLEIWSAMFKDTSYRAVEQAVHAYISRCNAFAPSIGQIKQLIYEREHRGNLSEGEAWALVFKALQRSSYYSEEEFSRLPGAIQKALGSATVLKEMAMDENLNISVESSNFARRYRQVLERERNDEVVFGVDRRIESANVKEIEGDV